MEKPVFLLGSHKSGTSLMRALLDGAPELFVLPLEAHFFQYGGFWVDYALRRALPKKLTWDDLVDAFVKLVNESNEKTSPTSDANLVGCWNVGRFAEYLRACEGFSFEQHGFRGFIDRYIEAAYFSLYGKPPAVKRFVEKSVENAEYAVLLHRFYPDAKFVHIVRNPYATLTAIRKHMQRGPYPFLGTPVAAMLNSYYYLYKNPLTISPYLVVRFEDLVTEPRQVMSTVAKFIEIEFTEELLQPTSFGRSWPGNSTSGEAFQGISTRPLVAWRSAIYPLEIDLVNRVFDHVLQDFGYERLDAIASVFRRCRKESLKQYLKNRFLWLFASRSHRVHL